MSYVASIGFITARKRRFAKVMFLHLSVSYSVQGGGGGWGLHRRGVLYPGGRLRLHLGGFASMGSASRGS